MSAKESPHPIDLHVGAKIRVRRKQVAMSQSALADKLGMTFQQVQKYERGANRVSASVLYKTAQVLEAPVSYFFEGLPDQPEGSKDKGADLKAVQALVAVPSVAAIPALTRDRQNLVGKLIDAIAGS